MILAGTLRVADVRADLSNQHVHGQPPYKEYDIIMLTLFEIIMFLFLKS